MMSWVKVRIPDHIEYPRINPVPEGVHRPFWSVMIPTYNCVKYLERTLRSVLEQDPGPDEMQIEVVDDCSSEGNPEAVVMEIGRGRVGFFRQPCNVGISANFTTCVQRAKGYWVHILNHDDMVIPGFYTTYRNFIEKHPEAVMVFCRTILIDEEDEWQQIMYTPPNQSFSGIVQDAAIKLLVQGNFICESSAVVARWVYEKVGGFNPILSYCADWEMWIRVAKCGHVIYIHQPYALYRVHSGSVTSRLVMSAKNIEESIVAIEIAVRAFPAKIQKRLRSLAYQHFSVYADGFHKQLEAKQEYMAALRHSVWAFKLHPSGRNLLRMARSVYLLWLAKKRR